MQIAVDIGYIKLTDKHISANNLRRSVQAVVLIFCVMIKSVAEMNGYSVYAFDKIFRYVKFTQVNRLFINAFARLEEGVVRFSAVNIQLKQAEAADIRPGFFYAAVQFKTLPEHRQFCAVFR